MHAYLINHAVIEQTSNFNKNINYIVNLESSYATWQNLWTYIIITFNL